MNFKTGLPIIIMLISIIYQIWAMLTVSMVLLYENYNVPHFIKVYVKALYGFIDRPWEIPSYIWFLFIFGGVCMGLTLASYMIKEYDKMSRHFEELKEKIHGN